jgi:hypothetical protein
MVWVDWVMLALGGVLTLGATLIEIMAWAIVNTETPVTYGVSDTASVGVLWGAAIKRVIGRLVPGRSSSANDMPGPERRRGRQSWPQPRLDASLGPSETPRPSFPPHEHAPSHS